MGRRGRKRDYNGRTGTVLRFVQSHPRWTYMRIGGVFGVTRQAIHQLVLSEEKIRGTRLHIRQRRISHLDSCRACQRAIRKLRKDPARRSADLFPGFASYAYHMAQLRKAGALQGVILFQSDRMLKAYRAWRDGAQAVQIERRYGYQNWHSTLAKLAQACPAVGRYEKRDLRPTWQKDLEGHDIERLTRFSISGRARTKKGTKVPYQQTIHALNKRLAQRNAGVTLLKMRGIEPITLRVKRWEDRDGNRRP